MANKTSQHILGTSANLLGFCLFIITSLHITDKAANTLIDEFTTFVALLLTASSIFSFAAIKTEVQKNEQRLEKIADYGKGWEAQKNKQKEAVQKAKIEAKTKEQEDEQRLERGRKEREEILAKFSALSDTEKEALRDMYAKTLKGGVMFENWKKAGNEPERKGLFLAAFPIYLKQNGLI